MTELDRTSFDFLSEKQTNCREQTSQTTLYIHKETSRPSVKHGKRHRLATLFPHRQIPDIFSKHDIILCLFAGKYTLPYLATGFRHHNRQPRRPYTTDDFPPTPLPSIIILVAQIHHQH